jgi:DNA-binding SARP family transcriptional activator
LSLLGGFCLVAGGSALEVPRVGERLFALLGLAPRPLPRCVVAETLWPDRPAQRSLANVRVTLWRLPAAARDLITQKAATLSLGAAVDVDTRLFGRLARKLMAKGAIDDDEWDPTNWQADLLPFWDDEWVVLERERLRHLRLHALEALASMLCEQNEWARAVDMAELAVDAEPLRESSVRVLVQAHLGAGNVADARLVFERHRAMVLAELGIEPSKLLRDLVGAATAR